MNKIYLIYLIINNNINVYEKFLRKIKKKKKKKKDKNKNEK